MSVAFRRESDEEHKEPRFELPIPPGPNLVTARGLVQTEAKVAALGDPWDKVLASPEGSPGREAGEAAIESLWALGVGLKKVGTQLGVLVQIPAG